MTSQIISTKLHTPPLRPDSIPRPRLIQILNRGLNRGHTLTLVSAPAGFGKTTLISNWLSTTDQSSIWLSLDERDNDSTRFWSYFVTAVQKIHPAAGKMALDTLQSTRMPFTEPLLTSLINDIYEKQYKFIIVLDDYHLIHEYSIHHELTFLLNHIPSQMHLVIITRIDPPLPLTRMRCRGLLTEIRTKDLRFTREESIRFLNESMGLDLSTDKAMHLAEVTEGWIVGLQMASISIQYHQDLEHLITTFKGNNHYILDYLTEEVLDKQPAAVQAFILETSILDRLNGSLCNAVTGRQDASEILRYLESNNLFITALDDTRCWYRYHQFFRDLTYSKLKSEYTDLIGELHLRASGWYEREGYISEAINHTLAASEFERAVRLIEENPILLCNKDMAITVQCWIEQIPRQIRYSRPHISAHYANALLNSGQKTKAECVLQNVENNFPQIKEIIHNSNGSITPKYPLDKTSTDVLAELSILYTNLALLEGDVGGAHSLLQKALALTTPESSDASINMRITLGATLYWIGRPDDTIRELTALLPVILDKADMNLCAHTAFFLSCARLQQARLTRAVECCQRILQSDHALHNGWASNKSILYVPLSLILFERNDLLAAEENINRAFKLGRPAAHWAIQIYGNLSLAYIKHVQGDTQTSREARQKAYDAAIKLNMPTIISGISPHLVKLAIAENDFLEAEHYSRLISPYSTHSSGYIRENELTTRALLHIAHGNPKEALHLLIEAGHLAKDAGRIDHQIRILALQAISLNIQGATEQALLPLNQSLSLGKPEGYTRSFIDCGKPIINLLQECVSQGTHKEYATDLLIEVETESNKFNGNKNQHVAHQSVLNYLSEREMQVLRLVCAGLSNHQIAKQLTVVEGTVKTHINHIFSKMNVKTRSQAITRAKELSILN